MANFGILAPQESLEVSTQVNDSLEINGNSLSFIGEVEGQAVYFYYTIESEAERDELLRAINYYDTLTVSGELTVPENMYQNPSSFDYELWLKNMGINNVFYIDEIKMIDDGR